MLSTGSCRELKNNHLKGDKGVDRLHPYVLRIEHTPMLRWTERHEIPGRQKESEIDEWTEKVQSRTKQCTLKSREAVNRSEVWRR